MSDLDTLQKLWDDICSGHIFNDGAGTHAMVVWAETVRIMLGGDVTLGWTRTTCTLNGTIMLTAPLGIIPIGLHRDFAKYKPGTGRYLGGSGILGNSTLTIMERP